MSADVEALRDVMRDVYMTRAQREAFDALLAAYDARSAVLSEQADTIQDAEAAAMQARQTAEYWKAEHLAGNAAYEALVAEIDGSLVKTVEESGWGDESGDGRIYGIPDRFIGSRVRLLLVREGGDGS